MGDEDRRMCDFLQGLTRDLMLFMDTEILAQSYLHHGTEEAPR